MLSAALLVDKADPWLVTEPDDEPDDFLTVIVAPVQGKTLRIMDCVVAARVPKGAAATSRQTSMPSLSAGRPGLTRQKSDASGPSRPTLPPLMRQKSDFSTNLATGTDEIFIRTVQLERIKYTGDENKGWMLQIPLPRYSDVKPVDYRASHYESRPHCNLKLSFEGDDDDEQPSISLEFLLADTPFDVPARLRQVFACRALPGMHLVRQMISTIWALHESALRNPSAIWPCIWRLAVLLSSSLSSRENVSASMQTLCERANAASKQADEEMQMHIAIAFGCCAAHVLQSKSFKDTEQNLELRLHCLPLDTRVLAGVKQLLMRRGQELEWKHIARLFREGLLALIRFDASTFPVASFASIQCGIWLDYCCELSSEKELAGLKQTSYLPSDADRSLRAQVDDIEELRGKVHAELTEKAMFNPHVVGEVFSRVSDAQAAMHRRMETLRALLSRFQIADDVIAVLELDMVPFATSRTQLSDVMGHLRRKSDEMSQLFRDVLGRKVQFSTRELEGLSTRDLDEFPRYHTVTVARTMQQAATSHAELGRDTTGQVASLRCVYGTNNISGAQTQPLVLVRLAGPQLILLCSPEMQTVRRLALHAVAHEDILTQPTMQICAIAGVPSSPHELVMCTRHGPALSPVFTIFTLRLMGFQEGFQVVRVRKIPRTGIASKLLMDVSCIAQFRDGTCALAAMNSPRLYLVPTEADALIKVINPQGLDTVAKDGPANEATLVAPVHFLSYSTLDDRVLFTSPKVQRQTSIRAITSTGTVKTIAYWNSGRVITGILPPSINIPDTLYAFSNHDANEPLCLRFEQHRQGEYAFVEVKQNILVHPQCIAVVPDQQFGIYACGFPNRDERAGEFAALSTGEAELRTRRVWDHELTAWDLAQSDFELNADAILDELIRSTRRINEVERMYITPKVNAEQSKNFWTTVALFSHATLLMWFPSFLSAAPSLSDVAKLFRHCSRNDLTDTQLHTMGSQLSTWMESYTWPASLIQEDVHGLVRLLDSLGQQQIISDLTLSRIFDSRHFVCPLQLGLELLLAALNLSRWDARDVFRLPVVHWLNRIDPTSMSSRPMPVFSTLRKVFVYWEELYYRLGMGDLASPPTSSVDAALDWLCVAHFKTACARRVSALRALVHLDATSPTASRAKQILLNNIVQIFGESVQSGTLYSNLQAVMLESVGVLKTNVWFQDDAALEFFSNGTLPSRPMDIKDVLAEPRAAEFLKAQQLDTADGNESPSPPKTALIYGEGRFEAAASGTYLFAWTGSGAGSSNGLMWLAVNPSSSSAPVKYVSGRLNQPITIELGEGEHDIFLKAFARHSDARLAVEGPYTQQTARDRLTMPNAAKRLPHPSACFFARGSIGGGHSKCSLESLSAMIIWSLIKSSWRDDRDAGKAATKRKFGEREDEDEGEATSERFTSIFSKDRTLTTLSKLVNELLDFGIDICHLFVCSFDLSATASATSKSARDLQGLLDRLQTNLRRLWKAMYEEDALTVAQLERISYSKASFAPVMAEVTAVSASEVTHKVDARQSEALRYVKHLEYASSVLAALSESVSGCAEDGTDDGVWDISSRIETLLRVFKKTRLGQLRDFFQRELSGPFRPSAPHDSAEDNLLRFVELHHTSVFFKHVWNRSRVDAASDGDGARLVGHALGMRMEATRCEWDRLRTALLQGTITWSELEDLRCHQVVDLAKEMTAFFKLASDADCLSMLHEWTVIYLLTSRWKGAMECVPLLAQLVSEDQDAMRARLVAVLDETGRIFESELPSESRGQLTLQQCSALAERTRVVDLLSPPVLLRLEKETCRVLQDALQLFHWYRKTRNDAEFATSIEMAFTKPELQVPQELWNHDKNCINEEILGLCADVRSTLHPLLFAENLPCSTFQGLFQSLNACGAAMYQEDFSGRLAALNSKRRALMQLLAGDEPTSTDSHNQLLFLQSRGASWVCSSASSELTMRYSVASTAEALEVVDKRLDRELLADLQSTLVLGAGNDHEDDFVKDLSNCFVEELSVCDQVQEICSRLSRTGHLCFNRFDIQVPFGQHTAQLKQAWNELEILAQEWEDTVQDFRERYPLLSCFTNRQLVGFVTLLLRINRLRVPSAADLTHFPAASLSDPGDEDNSGEYDSQALQLLRCRNPDEQDEQLDAAVWEACKQSFTIAPSSSTSAVVDPNVALHACGDALTAALARLAPRVPLRRSQFTKSEDGAKYSLLTSASSSAASVVKVVRVSSRARMIDVALTAYALLNRFPSRQDCLFVSRFVSSDSALNLVRRWEQEEDSDALYCLIGANALSFDHQREVGKALEHAAAKTIPGRKCPFLVIVATPSTSSEESAIEMMFAATGRIALAPLPVQDLRRYVRHSLALRGVEVKCFTSALPGQGKTFKIHRAAYPTELFLLRINAITSLDLLINIAKRAPGSAAVHVDISDSAARTTELAAVLFDFILLNGIVDEVTGLSAVWKSSTVCPKRLFVELPSQAPMAELRLCQLLDVELVVPSESTFEIDFDALRIGMGPEDFFSTRFDGTLQQRFM